MRAKYQIAWLESAKQDLRDIVFYLLDKAPLVGLGIQDEFDRQLRVLEDFPHICQENAYFPDVFDFKINGLPYVVAYKIFPEKLTVEILAVLHERRDRTVPRNYHL
jgi:plasmid stabilization system protein ParE